MITRRNFVTSTVAVAAIAPRRSFAVTEAPRYTWWPQIQGPAIDPARTRLIPGKGLEALPENSMLNLPELAFLQNAESNPAMAMATGVVLARALGPGFPLIAMDAVTGEFLWERERIESILGVYEDLVYVMMAPKSEGSHPLMVAVAADRPSDVWFVTEYDVTASVVVSDFALVYARDSGDGLELIARDLRSGVDLWLRDITEDRESVPEVLATNGEVVVGMREPASSVNELVAWDAFSGDLIWQMWSTGVISTPAFHKHELVVAMEEGIKRIDPASGKVLQEISLPNYIGGLVKMAFVKDAIILVDSTHIHSIDWERGEVNWSRAHRQAASTRDLMVCDGMILRIEDETETSIGENVLRGYDLTDGQLALEYRAVDSDENELDIASFIIGNGNLYLATNRGLGLWEPGDVAIESPADPATDREYSNAELGFSYAWDHDWSVLGSSSLTPNGMLLEHVDQDRYVASYAGPASESDHDFTRAWHVFFGPGDGSIREINPVASPDLDFVPADADVLAVVYRTTFTAPTDLCFGMRVLIPLEDDQRLVFEYFQYGVPFEGKIDSFATFFEHLEIGS